jgi:hypothetical protein
MRIMTFQSINKFLPDSRWFLGSLQFIANKFGDQSLQEHELSEVAGSTTGRLPPASIRFGLINEAQLEHRLGELGKTDLDPAGDKANHTMAVIGAHKTLISCTNMSSKCIK